MRETAWGRGFGITLICCMAYSTAGFAAQRCGDVAGDTDAVAAFQAGLMRSCDCVATADRLTFRRCAFQGAILAIRAGTLPRRCLHAVLACTRGTVIGKPGAVVCCRTDSRGHT